MPDPPDPRPSPRRLRALLGAFGLGVVIFVLAYVCIDLPRRFGQSAPVWLGLGCGDDCGGRIDLRKTLEAIPQGEWKVVGVPLKCFATAGADVAKLVQVPVLESGAALRISVSRIALGALNEAEATVACPVR